MPDQPLVEVRYGGTELSSYSIGDLIVADGITSLTQLAAVATGNVLLSGGVGTEPSWGKITSSHVDGTIALTSQLVTDHGDLSGLSDDDHTQYTLLDGRASGQTLYGGTGSGNDLRLRSTSHATKGDIFFGYLDSTFDEANGYWGLGTTNPGAKLDVSCNVDAASNLVSIFNGNNRTTAVNGDEAYFSLKLEDATGSPNEFVRLTWIAQDVVNTAQDGKLKISVKQNNSLIDVLTINELGLLSPLITSPTLVTPILGTPASGNLANCTFPTLNQNTTGNAATVTSISGNDHNSLANLTTGDVHTQYPLLLGRSGGQTLIGGTASGNNLTLQSTSHATKGKILFGTSAYDEVNNRLGIGTTSPANSLHVAGNAIIGTTSTINGGGYTLMLSKWFGIWAFDNDETYLIHNMYYNAGWKYRESSATSTFLNIGDGLTLRVAAAGTADAAISFVEAIKVLSSGYVGINTTSPTAALHLPASTTSRASLCIPSGTAPSSPVNGDIWSDGSNLKVRLGGTTYTLTKT